MLNRTPDTGSQIDAKMRANLPPLVWIRFFGFLGTGFGLGWLIRAAAYTWMTGAASTVIAFTMMLSISSQVALGIYLFLQTRKEQRIKSESNPTLYP
jgi:predicted lipid-binding transport protein (Tim44 family)